MFKRGSGTFWNKKGQEDIWNAVTLITGIAVAIFFVMVVYRFSSTERANLVFFSKDAAMLTDAILASPQNVELVYSNVYPSSYAVFKDSEIQLFTDSNTSGESPYRGSFIPMRSITMSTASSPLSVVYFLKNASFMTLSTQPWTILRSQQESQASQEFVGPPTPAEIVEQQRLQALYQRFLETQAPDQCFKELTDCYNVEDILYKEACEEFDCLCVTAEQAHINRCSADNPYFIIALNIPKSLTSGQ
jgi:hypothetical protein